MSTISMINEGMGREMERERERDARGKMRRRTWLSQIQEGTWDMADIRVVGPFKHMKRLTSGEAEADLSQGEGQA